MRRLATALFFPDSAKFSFRVICNLVLGAWNPSVTIKCKSAKNFERSLQLVRDVLII